MERKLLDYNVIVLEDEIDIRDGSFLADGLASKISEIENINAYGFSGYDTNGEQIRDVAKAAKIVESMFFSHAPVVSFLVDLNFHDESYTFGLDLLEKIEHVPPKETEIIIYSAFIDDEVVQRVRTRFKQNSPVIFDKNEVYENDVIKHYKKQSEYWRKKYG